MAKSTYKYTKPSCPICNKNKYVINDGICNGSSWGTCGVVHKGVSGEGGSNSYFYCTKCFVDFNIKTIYRKYEKCKSIGQS